MSFRCVAHLKPRFQELSFKPFGLYKATWLRSALRSDRALTERLLPRLRNLDLVLPAARSPNGYALDLGDQGRLFRDGVLLQKAKLLMWH